MSYVDFFSDLLDFDFNKQLKQVFINIDNQPVLTQKLEGSVYFYKNPNKTNTSFYLVTSSLGSNELEELRKYVWNKNNADIIFYYPDNTDKVEMYYAKYSPKVSNEESRLDVFSTSQEDIDKLEKIKHWQFDSGAFWFNYHSFVNKQKYKSIDKELVISLKSLKDELTNLLSFSISDENERNEIVQALIDRTLYIKYLEDNHIINSYFFKYYFEDE